MARPRRWTKSGEIESAPSMQTTMVLDDGDWLTINGWTLISFSLNGAGHCWSTYRHWSGRQITVDGPDTAAVDAQAHRLVEGAS